jgi:hypothetical protein
MKRCTETLSELSGFFAKKGRNSSVASSKVLDKMVRRSYDCGEEVKRVKKVSYQH